MKSRRRSRKNPLGPFTGRPMLAGVLAWMSVGAVGNVVLASIKKNQTDPALAAATVQAAAMGLLVGQIAASIAAYRAAATPKA
jgi:hypothetical protein